MSPETDIFSKDRFNEFFPDQTDGHYRGGSWNGEVDGMKATYGAIEPDTEATYSIGSREIVFVESGSASVSFNNDEGKQITSIHQAGDLFELPLGRDFTLKTIGKEKFIYGCLYPDAKR
ncbi:DUF1255 family protein [Candidatus Saccharibacteria bacterium]|nr:DUF1255 family protein [Candidatus Saccharibacteria bacterium]MBI3338481.1 DUF1255 family protein [Candidatus Saccharibacteria bacterium]